SWWCVLGLAGVVVSAVPAPDGAATADGTKRGRGQLARVAARAVPRHAVTPLAGQDDRLRRQRDRRSRDGHADCCSSELSSISLIHSRRMKNRSPSFRARSWPLSIHFRTVW